MAKQHRHELGPTVEATRMALCACLSHRPLKIGAWKKLEQLGEDAAESCHRGWLSEREMVGVATRPSAYSARSTPFSFG
jgi:hypothetical protein